MKFIAKHLYLILVFLCLDIIAILFVSIKTNYEITMPGGLTEVTSVISIEGSNKVNGSINSIYVMDFENCNALQYLIAEKADSCLTYDLTYYNTKYDMTNAEKSEAGLIQKNQSFEAALICAYTEAKKSNSNIELSYKEHGLIVYTHMINSPFIVGDIIVGINGVMATNWSSFVTEYNRSVNDCLHKGAKFIVERGNSTIEITLDEKVSASSDYLTYYGFYTKYDINEEEFFPKYTIGKTYTVGPSAGLLQTLCIYAELSDTDIILGRKICGTGTISANGTVGAIGGISQKVITAFRQNCDVFLCPEANYEEALKTYNKIIGKEKMQLVCVSSFNDAINALKGGNN